MNFELLMVAWLFCSVFFWQTFCSLVQMSSWDHCFFICICVSICIADRNNVSEMPFHQQLNLWEKFPVVASVNFQGHSPPFHESSAIRDRELWESRQDRHDRRFKESRPLREHRDAREQWDMREPRDLEFDPSMVKDLGITADPLDLISQFPVLTTFWCWEHMIQMINLWIDTLIAEIFWDIPYLNQWNKGI